MFPFLLLLLKKAVQKIYTVMGSEYIPALMVLINLCFEDSIALKRNLTVKVGETWEKK